MNEEQETIFRALMEMVEPLARPKFTAGTIEHPGLITDLSDEQLFVMETEEIIDLLHYRLTRLLKRKNAALKPSSE